MRMAWAECCSREMLGLPPRRSSTQLGSDEVERIMAEKSSKCLHQSSGAGENDVGKMESSAKTSDSVLPQRFGCRANSKGIVPPWVAGCVACVLSRSEKRNVDHNARVRSKMRKCRDVLTQDGGAVDPGDERGAPT